jgi:hypothetical protein
VIVAYAGRRPSPEGFPEGNVDSVARRLEQLMAGLRPRLVVGSAAAGADLLALKAAIRVDAQARVVLAGDEAEFRKSSVADVGPDWARQYDALLDGLKDLERETKIKLVDIDPDEVARLDSVEHVGDLCRIGQAVAARDVKPEHYADFV